MTDEYEKRVLMIAHVFPPFFSVGGSIRVIKFIKYLVQNSLWRPSVLTIDDSQEYDTQRKEGSASLLTDVPSTVTIHRTRAGEASVTLLERGRAVRKRNRLLAPFITLASHIRAWVKHHLLLPDENITWLPFAVKAGRRIVRDESPDVLFVTCPPHSAALAGVLLKWLTRRPLVVDFRDDWVDTPWFRQKSPFARLIERIQEGIVVRAADRMILVTEWSRDAFRKRYPRVNPHRFEFIPNGCDLNDFASLPDTVPHSGTFTIVHAGLLTDSNDWKRSPEGFFEALCTIRANHPGLWHRMHIVFTGRLPAAYRELATRSELSQHIEETGFLPWDELLALMASADLLLTINYEGFATLIPGKIYEYWAVGGPPVLLLSCEGAAQQLIAKHNLGTTINPGASAAIATYITRLNECKDRGEPVRICQTGIERYDRAYLASELKQVLDTVATGGRQHNN